MDEHGKREKVAVLTQKASVSVHIFVNGERRNIANSVLEIFRDSNLRLVWLRLCLKPDA